MSSSASALPGAVTGDVRLVTSFGALEYITRNIEEVSSRIAAATNERSEEIKNCVPDNVRLVAVSKMKSALHVLEAYKNGHRHFGENYVQELVTKSQELEEECPDIKWHFIGHLQSNKIGKIISVGKSLSVVETVDSQRIAGVINTQRGKWIEENPEERRSLDPLDVMIQVNTSGEEAKGGIAPGGVNEIVTYINGECPFLRFSGLMTIGRDYEHEIKPNPDFVLLREVRDSVCRINKFNPKDIELSMGMSSDYEEAIHLGSSNVRVGSTIFGERTYGKH